MGHADPSFLRQPALLFLCQAHAGYRHDIFQFLLSIKSSLSGSVFLHPCHAESVCCWICSSFAEYTTWLRSSVGTILLFSLTWRFVIIFTLFFVSSSTNFAETCLHLSHMPRVLPGFSLELAFSSLPLAFICTALPATAPQLTRLKRLLAILIWFLTPMTGLLALGPIPMGC